MMRLLFLGGILIGLLALGALLGLFAIDFGQRGAPPVATDQRTNLATGPDRSGDSETAGHSPDDGHDHGNSGHSEDDGHDDAKPVGKSGHSPDDGHDHGKSGHSEDDGHHDAKPSGTPGHSTDDEHDNGKPAGGHSDEDGHEHGNEPGESAENTEEGVVYMSAAKASAAEIDVEMAERGKIARRLAAPGVVVANSDRIARVPVKVVGTVVEMRKRLGEPVTKGEVVAVLDSREIADAKSEYLTAIVDLDLQETNYNRAKSLWEKRISAEAQYLEARATFVEAQLRADLGRQKLVALNLNPKQVEQSSKNELSASESSLRRYEIKSPVDGRVIERKVEVGSSVGQDSDPKELYTVADLSTVWIELAIPPGSLDGIVEGQSVSITGSGGDNEERGAGKIVFISPVLDLETRSARVIAEIDNAEATWRPGTYVTALIAMQEELVNVLVPRASIQLIEGKQVVFVQTNVGFEKREVQLGKSDEDAVEIVAGLERGDLVAAANTFLLKAELGKAEAEHSH